jgi:hypothetical protein
MALTTTTLSSAVAQSDVSIVVASATGFAAGNLVLVDGEQMQVAKNYVSGTTIPVQRGIDGTVQTTHKVSANVVTFLASDQAARRRRRIRSGRTSAPVARCRTPRRPPPSRSRIRAKTWWRSSTARASSR